MEELSATEARAEFSELVNRVAYGGQPVMITRHGKALVALVPVSYLDSQASEPDETDNYSSTPAVLDLTARGEASTGSFTVAAHDKAPKTR